ncbi:MAG: ABC transporter substrate-binding protein [Dongiaceae bacterium]
MRRMLLGGVLPVAFAAGLLLAGNAAAQDTLKIGVLATFEGPFAILGEDSLRGANMAFNERNMTAGGKKLEIITGSSDASPESAIQAARKLVEQDKVDILIGPLSGDEGLAMRDYAKTQPQVTFINGTSAAEETTLIDPAANFFRFTTNGVQWMAGLGTYSYETKGYKKVVTIGEDYSYPYTQVKGFMIEFCKAGGRVVDKFWTPLGTKDYSSVVASIPDDIDAIYVALGGADAVNFLTQYEQAGGSKPLIGGSITVDQSVLSAKGKRRDYLIGTPSAGPLADNWDDPKWQAFVAAYKKSDDKAFNSPTLFSHGYYIEALAMMQALDTVNGDLSDGHKKFREALSTQVVDTPTGKVRLDHNRNAIGSEFLTEIAAGEDGNLYNKVIKVIPDVNATLGVPEDEYRKTGVPSRDAPSCP